MLKSIWRSKTNKTNKEEFFLKVMSVVSIYSILHTYIHRPFLFRKMFKNTKIRITEEGFSPGPPVSLLFVWLKNSDHV